MQDVNDDGVCDPCHIHILAYSWILLLFYTGNGLIYACCATHSNRCDFAPIFWLQPFWHSFSPAAVVVSVAHKLFIHFIYHFIKLWTFLEASVLCVLYALVILFRTLFSAPSITLSFGRYNFGCDREWEKQLKKAPQSECEGATRKVFDGCVFSVSIFFFIAFAILSSQNVYI